MLIPGLLLGAATSVAASAGPTKVLLIVADDLGVDSVGIYGLGADLGLTPNIDRLAARGVVFERAYANPVCSPTRATILTGRYCGRTGIGRALAQPEDAPGVGCGQHELLAGTLTLPEWLSQSGQGWHSAAIGKWHLNMPCPTNGGFDAPRVRGGFQYFAGTPGNFVPRSFGTPSDSDYFCWPRVVNGALDCGGTCCPGTYNGGSGAKYRARYATTDNVDDALAWIGGRPLAEPWFCYLAFNAPHAPLQAPPAGLHDELVTYPVGHREQGLPVSPATTAFELVQAGWFVDIQSYFRASLIALDREVGRLVEQLPADTWIVFVGDNGSDAFALAPPFDYRHGKGTLYETGIRVPLIVSGPGVVDPARTSPVLVNSVDLFTTLCALGGLGLPTQVPIDGLSFAGVLTDPSVITFRPTAFSEYFEPNDDPSVLPNPPRTREGYAIVNDRFKLIRHTIPNATSELFDLSADPDEQCELIAGGNLNALEVQNLAALNLALDQLLETF